jgi:hypothetical protein
LLLPLQLILLVQPNITPLVQVLSIAAHVKIVSIVNTAQRMAVPVEPAGNNDIKNKGQALKCETMLCPFLKTTLLPVIFLSFS